MTLTLALKANTDHPWPAWAYRWKHGTSGAPQTINLVEEQHMVKAMDCLRWASGLAIGVRGGWPANEVQQVLSACARGEDWQALRDKLQTRRTR